MKPEVVTVTPAPAPDAAAPEAMGLHVATALARAGHQVAATGWLGRDSEAAFAAVLATDGIADEFVRIHGGPGVGPSPAERGVLLDRILGLAVTAPTGAPGWFVLAGGLPPDVDPGFFCELATLVGAAGARVVLETSGEPLRRALKAEPHVITANLHELEALIGAPLPGRDAVVAAARGLLRGETELIAVSMGNGVLLVEAGRVITATAPVSVGMSVVAGGALVAGIVTARLRRLDLPELARLASGFALAAETGMPLEEWLPRVAIETQLPA